MATPRKRNPVPVSGDTSSNGHVSQPVPGRGEEKADEADNTKVSTVTAVSTILTPALVATFVLIFGGCCSNVYVLESIVSLSPASGSLFTFLQFLFTSAFALPTQLTTKPSPDSPSGLIPRFRSRYVPLYKWVFYTMMFLTVNMLNNTAFNYRISIPLHIILRSAGPVTSMLVGYLFAGRKYPIRKIFAVLLLFSGVVLAALADASSKGKVSMTDAPTTSALSHQLPGFALLFSALVISAFMGIYTDELYRQHGRSGAVANENLFYSHALSLPIFGLQYKSLHSQYLVMLSNASKQSAKNPTTFTKGLNLPGILQPLAPFIPSTLWPKTGTSLTPLLLLVANGLTQVMCISGVHRLATQTTSLTVSVVLNIRKLVSLILSIWLFGNRLPFGVTVGAALVFLGVGLYSAPSRPGKDGNKKDK